MPRSSNAPATNRIRPPPRRRQSASPRFGCRKPRGRHHALVLFAKFKEEAPRITTAPDFAEALFDEEHQGSLAHFFSIMSAGQLELTATIMPKRYESKRPADFYVAKVAGEIGMFSRFASEVLRAADADVDFTQFDNDGPDGIPNSGDDDGSVDYVFINVLSAPRGFIIGGATGVAGLRFDPSFASRDIGANGDAIEVSPRVRAGSLSREGGFSQTAGTMAHEYGHALGLPDLYDLKYSGPEDDSAGIGKWGLMGWGAHGWNGDDGPNPFSAWSLKKLGWIGEANSRLERIEGDVVDLSVEDLFSGGMIYQVALPAPARHRQVRRRSRQTRASAHRAEIVQTFLRQKRSLSWRARVARRGQSGQLRRAQKARRPRVGRRPLHGFRISSRGAVRRPVRVGQSRFLVPRAVVQRAPRGQSRGRD